MKRPDYALGGAIAALACAAAASAQDATDAISREFTVDNRQPAAIDAVSREFSVEVDDAALLATTDATSREFSVAIAEIVSVLDAISREFTTDNEDYRLFGALDATTREFSVFDDRSAMIRDSSDLTIRAKPFAGTLTQQLAAANASPPAFDVTWANVAHADDNARASFVCGSVPNPLDWPFVDAESYLVGTDEVTLDNCGSAFYRVTFELPNRFDDAEITALTNADDLAVAWLNGQRISATAAATDLAIDRTDAGGKRVLTWPTIDPLDTSIQTHFQPGLNELVFAVVGDIGPTEPTGVEFSAAVTFFLTGDVDVDCRVDLIDLAYLLTYFGTPEGATRAEGDLDHNGAVELTDLATLLQNFGTACP